MGQVWLTAGGQKGGTVGKAAGGANVQVLRTDLLVRAEEQIANAQN